MAEAYASIRRAAQAVDKADTPGQSKRKREILAKLHEAEDAIAELVRTQGG